MTKKLLIVATTALLVVLLSSCSSCETPTNDEIIAEKKKCETAGLFPEQNSCGRIKCEPLTKAEIRFEKSVDLCISQGKTWRYTANGAPECNP